MLQRFSSLKQNRKHLQRIYMRGHGLRKRKRFTRKYLPEMLNIKHTYIYYIYVAVDGLPTYYTRAESHRLSHRGRVL